MLREIYIANEATYTGDAQVLDDLKPINFIFGTNGSGKTTISRLIADPSGNTDCRLVWENGREIERLVYNTDFTEKNLAPQLPGIFTLGTAEAEILAKVEGARAKVGELQAEIDKLEMALEAPDGLTGKRSELRALRSAFEERCWTIKTAHDGHFRDAFTGVRNSRANFCDKILSELAGNTAEVRAIDNLKRRALTVFATGVQLQPNFPSLAIADLIELERAPILAKKVVGKDDIDIAALIRRLGNSDWVRQGLGYAVEARAQCPFCQQGIDEGLLAKLNAYFDETYIGDIAEIDRVREAYRTFGDHLLAALAEIQATDSPHLDQAVLAPLVDRLSTLIELNQRHLERKRREASAPVVLDSLRESFAAVSSLVEKANRDIAVHNAMVENLGSERTVLVAEIWKCLLDESRDPIDAYTSAKENLDKAVTGLSAGIESKKAQLATAKATLFELEKAVTSVQPTVTEINAILASFGFTSFRLATAGEQGSLYEIIRGDGSDAGKTLSEGERSFITFLYFYHLIRGSTSTSGMNVDRVVVFDDPVSSLDSDVLFIVSSLIKRILEEACLGTGLVKQAFVLTHNIYFHKEVSFDPKRQHACRAHETFWIVRKVSGRSVLVNYDHNPIKTSYEMLWQEVRSPDRSKIAIQNTLRRIIEHYFKILGNVDKDEIIAKFEGRDQQICAALFSWVNDGSHNFSDDLYISADEGLTTRYLAVFRQIFERTKHIAHYEMMMGAEALALEEALPTDAEIHALADELMESAGERPDAGSSLERQ